MGSPVLRSPYYTSYKIICFIFLVSAATTELQSFDLYRAAADFLIDNLALTSLYFVQTCTTAIGNVPRRPGSNPRGYRSPAEHSLHHESHKIQCADGVFIHTWLILQQQKQSSSSPSSPPTLIFFHGNAGNIGLRLPNAVHMHRYLGCNIFLVEYRGYGDSDSVKPNEAGLRLDSEAALKYIVQHPKIDPSNLFIFGRSLGGAVGFHLADYAQKNNIPLAGLIVENTFTSISKMVDHLMPLVAPLKGLVLRIEWDSSVLASKIQLPVLYLAGAADEIVPHSHMLDLYQRSKICSSLARIHIVQDGKHNETWMQGGRVYWDVLNKFIGEALSLRCMGPGHRLGSRADGSFSSTHTLNEPGSGSDHLSISMGSSAEINNVKGQGSAIPTISNSFMGIAKDAVGATSKSVVNSAKTTNESNQKVKKDN